MDLATENIFKIYFNRLLVTTEIEKGVDIELTEYYQCVQRSSDMNFISKIQEHNTILT